MQFCLHVLAVVASELSDPPETNFQFRCKIILIYKTTPSHVSDYRDGAAGGRRIASYTFGLTSLTVGQKIPEIDSGTKNYQKYIAGQKGVKRDKMGKKW